jgi:hypothetical protein
MSAFLAILWPFLIYWLILFVACYVVVEFGQNYLYDETTPAVGLKVALGSFLLAAFLTWTRTSFDTMFTSELAKTVFQAIIWFAVFTLVYRFQPQHGVMIGVATMLIVAGLATLGVDSMMKPSQRGGVLNVRRPNKPFRQSANLAPPAAPKDASKEAPKDAPKEATKPAAK